MWDDIANYKIDAKPEELAKVKRYERDLAAALGQQAQPLTDREQKATLMAIQSAYDNGAMDWAIVAMIRDVLLGKRMAQQAQPCEHVDLIRSIEQALVMVGALRERDEFEEFEPLRDLEAHLMGSLIDNRGEFLRPAQQAQPRCDKCGTTFEIRESGRCQGCYDDYPVAAPQPEPGAECHYDGTGRCVEHGAKMHDHKSQ